MKSVPQPIDICQYVLMTEDACCPPLLGPSLDEEDAEALAATLKALADPVRLRLVNLIAAAPDGEVCACDLPAQLDRSQPTISHHLSLLTKAGIVEREQRGRWAWFTLRSEQLAALCLALDPDCATR